VSAGGRKRKILVAAGCAAFVLAVLLMRVFWDGRAALAEGDAALERRDPAEAITRWRRAARWYAPGAPHVSAAYERLEELAAAAEEAGDRATALEAWRAIRSSILATRSFYTPFPSKLERANAKIAELMALEPGPADAGDTVEKRRAWHLALLQRDESPALGWTLLALAGFGLWIGGGFYFAFRGLDKEDRLVKRAAARAGIVIVVGLLVWMVSLYNA
jgi:hypothetical protein